MIIEKDYDNWKSLQKKIHVSNKMNLSSNINEGIKAVSFFKWKDFTRTKSTKRQTNDFLLLRCFMLIKMLSFLFLSTCMRFVLFVRVKSFCKKKNNKEVLNYPNTLIYITTYLYYFERYVILLRLSRQFEINYSW